MTAAAYKTLRQQLGSLRLAAAILGVRHTTLDRRERGESPINREAEYAIQYAVLYLPLAPYHHDHER